MKVTATEAKNRFGTLYAQAKREPVVVHKGGKPDTVILSIEDYQRLVAPAKSGLAARRKWFNETYKAWIDERNCRVAEHGLWNEELRIW